MLPYYITPFFYCQSLFCKNINFFNFVNLITSHVNSYKRKSTDHSSPIELFRAYFGPEILDKLNISLVEPNSVTLTSELLKKVQ